MKAYFRLVLLLTAAQSATALGLVQPTRRHHLGNGCPSRRLAERADSDTTPRFAGTALPGWLTAPLGLDKRATTCINGNNFCFKDPTQACRQCGSCCANGRCATNFGSCCPGDSNICAYGYTCCASADGPSKCCYAGTSFCCPTANGCCMNGQTCGKNGCEGTASFAVQSVTTTTTLYTTDFTATTISTSTTFTTFSITYIQLLTANVTSSGAATATSTVYVKSTKFVKRTVTELAIPSATPAAAVQARGPEEPSEPLALTAAPASPVSAAIHDGLAAVGLLQKRAVTSFIYTYLFIWVGVPGTATITKLMVVPTTHVVTSTSTVTNTVFADARVTVTVTSTITIEVEAAATMSTVLESTMRAKAASSDRMKPPDPTAASTGTGPALGAGAAATAAPGGDGLDSVSQGTSPTTDDGGAGGGGSSGGMMGNGTTESAPPAAPLPELGAAAKAWIGAGAAVAGLAVLGLSLLLICRHRGNAGGGRTPVMRMALRGSKLTRIEAGPPFGTGSSIFENVRTWTPPMPPPPPPPPPSPPPPPPHTSQPVPPHQQITPPHTDNPQIWPSWLTDAAAGDAAAAAATTAAATLGSHMRHISDGSVTVRQSAYSVSSYGPSYGPSIASPAATTATARLPPEMGHLGLRRWTVEMDSTESLRESERTFGAGPVYDPARYMEMGARDSPGRSRELLGVAGPPGAVLGSCGG